MRCALSCSKLECLSLRVASACALCLPLMLEPTTNESSQSSQILDLGGSVRQLQTRYLNTDYYPLVISHNHCLIHQQPRTGEAYPSGAHFGAQFNGLTSKYQTIYKIHFNAKHPNFFNLSVGDESKRFVQSTPGPNVIKLFTSVIYKLS